MSALALAAALVGAWELYADLGPVDSFLLPAPHQVARALADDRDLLWSNLLVTAREVALGLAVALLAALALSVAIHLVAAVRRTVYPLVLASQTVPVVIVAPLLVTWFGYGMGPKVGIVALVCFFPVVVGILDGLSGIDPDLVKLLRTLDATRWQIFVRAELPWSLPGAFSGARIAVTVACIGAVLAEYSGSEAGLGRVIQQATPQFQTARAYAAVIVLSALALALFELLNLLQRRVLAWAPTPRGVFS